MIILRWCIGLVATCLLAGQALASELPTLSAQDFLARPYRGFTMDNISNVSAADFDTLAAMGVNLVRVGIMLERCAQCSTYSIPPKSLMAVDQVVALAGTRHIYVVLTLAPERPAHQAYWEDAVLQTSIIEVWSRLAERYKWQPAMGGFDLINEPNPPGKANEAARRYTDLAGRLIEAVRKVDPQRMIVYEPAPRGNAFYAFKALKMPLPYSNVLYSPHFYWPVEVTHQGIPGGRGDESYPTWRRNKDGLSEYLAPVREFARKYRLPIYVGEFGCVRYAPDNTAYRWIKDAGDLFEAEGWSWTFHSFRGYDGWDQELPAGAYKPANAAGAAAMRSLDTPTMTLLRGYLRKNQSTGS